MPLRGTRTGRRRATLALAAAAQIAVSRGVHAGHQRTVTAQWGAAPQRTRSVSSMVRSRYVIAPSGELSLGQARTAIVAWLHTRAAGGTITLRVGDLDPRGFSEEAWFRQMGDLAWLGLTWDGAVVRQTERLDAYALALQQLREAGLTYPCFCLATTRCACRGRAPDGALEAAGVDKPHAIRLAGPPGSEGFDDIVCGRVEVAAAARGDVMLATADGTISDLLANALDDALPATTHAIRTGDLLVDAACQQLITRLLGLTPPTFAHLPALPGDDSMTVREQRDRGLHPEAVVGALAGALGIGSGAPATLDELIPHAAGLTG